jgi:SIR2-like domain
LIGREQLDECILKALAPTEAAVPTAAHKELPGLGLDLLWTTNYDDLIELAYREDPGGLEVVSDDNLFRETGKTTLFKLFGTLADAGRIVIARGDYESYRATARFIKRSAWRKANGQRTSRSSTSAIAARSARSSGSRISRDSAYGRST